jgi:RNA polymerase sigma factor (TIGR02999 family)
VGNITQLLNAAERGDSGATEELFATVYEELRRLAAGKLARESSSHTLQATALVNEAYLRLIGEGTLPSFRDRGHFFSAAATAMRRILIDNARRRQATKRGGHKYRRQILNDVAEVVDDDELLAVDAALEKLANQNPLIAKLVELRYFSGLTGDQTAEVLGISPSAVDRHWTYARAWLRREIQRF